MAACCSTAHWVPSRVGCSLKINIYAQKNRLTPWLVQSFPNLLTNIFAFTNIQHTTELAQLMFIKIPDALRVNMESRQIEAENMLKASRRVSLLRKNLFHAAQQTSASI